MEKGKIFGIGLSRTGTSSLNEALKILGYNSIHFPIIMQNSSCKARLKYRLNKWAKELSATQPLFPDFVKNTENELVFQPPISKDFDALTDLSVTRFYPQLDSHFPNSKFILTIRAETAWLQSCSRFFVEGNHQFFKWLQVNVDMYGSTVYNETLFREAYQKHLQEVKIYFEKRPSDLLILDITNGDGWEQLCPFLGVDIPAQAFPFKNAAT